MIIVNIFSRLLLLDERLECGLSIDQRQSDSTSIRGSGSIDGVDDFECRSSVFSTRKTRAPRLDTLDQFNYRPGKGIDRSFRWSRKLGRQQIFKSRIHATLPGYLQPNDPISDSNPSMASLNVELKIEVLTISTRLDEANYSISEPQHRRGRDFHIGFDAPYFNICRHPADIPAEESHHVDQMSSIMKKRPAPRQFRMILPATTGPPPAKHIADDSAKLADFSCLDDLPGLAVVSVKSPFMIDDERYMSISASRHHSVGESEIG